MENKGQHSQDKKSITHQNKNESPLTARFCRKKQYKCAYGENSYPANIM